MLRVAVMIVTNFVKTIKAKAYSRCLFLMIEILVLLSVIILLNKKMKALKIEFLSGDFKRINNEFCTVLASIIIQFSLSVYAIIEKNSDMNRFFFMIDILVLAIPVLYILWLNHKTFKSLDRISDQPLSR